MNPSRPPSPSAARLLGVALLLLPVLGAGCGNSYRIKKLDTTEYNQYIALRPFMTDDEKTEWLKLKTDADRDQWLKDKKYGIPESSLWDKFYKYSDKVRQQIIDGKVEVGWTKDQVVMAWGQPYDKRKLTGRPAERSELLVYRFTTDKDGVTQVFVDGAPMEKVVSRTTALCYIDDNVLTSLENKDGWVEE